MPQVAGGLAEAAAFVASVWTGVCGAAASDVCCAADAFAGSEGFSFWQPRLSVAMQAHVAANPIVHPRFDI
jgi:hypothetical protein